MYQKMEEEIENLTQRVAEQAGQRCGARLLMTHPGVGPVTALATEVFRGGARRFVDWRTPTAYQADRLPLPHHREAGRGPDGCRLRP